MHYVILAAVMFQTAICYLDPQTAAFTKFLLWDAPIALIGMIL
jgi:hypothetical protein